MGKCAERIAQQKLAAIEYFGKCGRVVNTARYLGVTTQTIRNWFKADPEFKMACEKAHEEEWDKWRTAIRKQGIDEKDTGLLRDKAKRLPENLDAEPGIEMEGLTIIVKKAEVRSEGEGGKE